MTGTSFFCKVGTWRRDSSGATALESALLLPPFLILVIGTMQVGIAMDRGNTVQYAVERAARSAVISASPTEASVQAVSDDILRRLGKENIDLDLSFEVDNSGRVPLARIRASYSHVVSVPALPSFTVNYPIDVTVPLRGAS